MLTRAAIVLLVILNLGVAVWWVTRPAVGAPTFEDEPVTGTARLRLLSEVPRPVASAAPAAAAGTILATAARPTAASERCFAFGPFIDAPAVARARAVLQPQAARLRVRETVSARGWRVVVPPLADRAAAQAMTQRIAAAGIEDFFVMNEGADTNAIALGRYRSEDAARQREAALRAAGFEAQAQPLGEAARQSWLDLATGDAFDPAAMRRASGAARAEPLDCASLR